jgi:cytochrome c5
MKKYIYSLCLVGVIVYSCKTQQVAPATTSPKSSTATANLSKEEMLKKGEDLFNLKCGRCHGLPSPSEYTAADWQPIMARMAPKAKLNSEETNWVLAYVNANAKK